MEKANETLHFRKIQENEKTPVYMGFMIKTTSEIIYATHTTYYGHSKLFVCLRFYKPTSSIFC